MILQDIKKNINDCTEKVLLTAEQCCINSFSKEVKYIKNVITEKGQQDSLIKMREKKVKLLNKRNFLTLDKLTLDIFRNQNNVRWVDFVLFYTSVAETIFIVDFVEVKNSENINFHGCFMTPCNYEESNEKFDINWAAQLLCI